MPPKLLTIGGSDSGGAAGVQADLKTWGALGVYGMSALTVVTAQNSVVVSGVHAVPDNVVALQIGTVLSDYGADGIKTGFIGRSDTLTTIARELDYVTCPIVVDPVLVTHRGESMFSAETTAAYHDHLLPLATVITPNRHEAALLTGTPVDTVAAAEQAARALHTRYATAVLVTGIPAADALVDVLATDGVTERFSAERIPTANTHGSGDTLSAVVAAYLAQGRPLIDAVTAARAFTHSAIAAGATWQLGAGHGPLWHAGA